MRESPVAQSIQARASRGAIHANSSSASTVATLVSKKNGTASLAIYLR